MDTSRFGPETEGDAASIIPDDAKAEDGGLLEVKNGATDADVENFVDCEPYFYVVAGNDSCAVGFYFDHDCGFANQEQLVITTPRDGGGGGITSFSEICYVSNDLEKYLRELMHDMIDEVTLYGVHPRVGVPPNCDVGSSPVIASIYAEEADAISTSLDVIGPATGTLVCELLSFCDGYEPGECSVSPRK